MRIHHDLLVDLGHELRRGASVLDFGCGAGAMVREYRAACYDAYGCDVHLGEPGEHLLQISSADHRVPFENERFDFVFSDQVMEHVQDHHRAFSEIHRVLKPGGVSLHVFPSRLRPIECHVFVPLAGTVRSSSWLTFWAWLGIRNRFQRGKSFREVARLNADYLRTSTNYLTRRELEDVVSRSFADWSFVEPSILKLGHGHARFLCPGGKVPPGLASLYATFATRVLFLRKAK